MSYWTQNCSTYHVKTFKTLFASVRKTALVLLMSFMVGLHNFYQEEDKVVDDMVITIVEDSTQSNDGSGDS